MFKKIFIIFLFFNATLMAKNPLEKRFDLYFRTLDGAPYRILYILHQDAVEKKQIEINAFHNVFYKKIFWSSLPPADILIFSNQKQFLIKSKVPKGYQAYYLPDKQMIVTYDGQDTGVLLHEIVHHWIKSNIRGNIRLWFEEGLASLFESPVRTKNGIDYFLPNNRHEKLKGKWIRLDQFMNTVDLARDQDKAQARLIFLWLAQNNLLEKYVRAYADNLDFDFSGVDALEEVTGKNIKELDSILKIYSDSLH